MAESDWVDVPSSATDSGWVDVPSALPTTKKTPWQFLTTPISKQITGKSIGERADLLRKQSEVLSTVYGKKGGRIPSTTEFFMLQLPAATGQALINAVDLSPLDVGLIAATAGAFKIPVSGTTVGEVAKTVPIGKGFFGGVKELGRYQQTLKAITPLSSRGISVSGIPTGKITPETQGDLMSKVNLEKYTPEVQEGIKKIIAGNPDLLKRGVVSHEMLDLMAQQLEATPIVKKILSLPEGQMAAEILKLRQGEDAIIRSALSDDLTQLGTNLKNILQLRQTQSVGKVATETGRALEQFKIPIEAQQELANLINQKIALIKKDPTLGKQGINALINGLVDLRKQVLSKDFNPSWIDKGYEFWMNSILSGPWTHTVNITSNILFGVGRTVEKAAAIPFDILLSKFTGKREHYWSEIPAQIKGFGRALTGEKLPTGIAAGSKLDVRTGLIKGTKGEVIRIPTKLLVIEDNIQKRMIGWSELVARAEAIAKQEGLKGSELIARKNQLIANPTEKLTAEVTKEQLYRTFQDSTGFGELLKGIPQKFFRWILPFRNTLASIIEKGMERTPAGFLKVGYKGLKVMSGVGYPQKELAMDLGNASMGTAVAAMTTYAFLKGNITGAAPKDKAKRDVFYAQGKQPYSVLYKGQYIPFNKLEPYGTALMQMVDFVQGYKESDKEMPTGKVADAVARLSYSFTNKSFLSGMSNLVNALSNPERYGEDFFSRLAGGFSPFSGLTRNIRQMTDLTVREPQGITETILNEIPGLAGRVPARVSSFGEIVKRKPVGITRFVPFPITNAERNIVADELSRLDMSIGYPSKNLTNLTGTEEKLKRDEYNQLLMRKGGATVNTLQKLISSQYYSRLPDSIKTKMIENIVSKISQVTKDELKIKKFVSQSDWVDVK